MTTKDQKRAELKAQAEDAQGRGNRAEVFRLLTELAELDKPERAVAPKVRETRRRKT